MGDDWTLEIDLSELRQAIECVLDHVEQANGKSLSLPADYFWSVAPPGIYDPSSPPDLTMGQLSESWRNLSRERAGTSEQTRTFAAVWLGDLMKAIGHHAEP